MPKLNSQQLKHKRMILDWAGKAWNGLKESSKVRIWCVMYDKSQPTTLKIEGEIDHYHNLADQDLNRIEAEILEGSLYRQATSEN